MKISNQIVATMCYILNILPILVAISLIPHLPTMAHTTLP